MSTMVSSCFVVRILLCLLFFFSSRRGVAAWSRTTPKALSSLRQGPSSSTRSLQPSRNILVSRRGPSSRLSSRTSSPTTTLSAMSLPWNPSNVTTTTTSISTTASRTTTRSRQDRFDRAASTVAAVDKPCLLTLYGQVYNVTAWAQAHPGGHQILHKFHGRDNAATTAAFEKAHHSAAAMEMLQAFWIGPAVDDAATTTSNGTTTALAPSLTVSTAMPSSLANRRPRWMQKLFTREDPIGIHKYLGVFCLLHFVFRFGQMFLGDPSAGWGTRLGRGPHWGPALCLIPHAALSLTSLIFHTVPKERVVGKPMIWQEYRTHNIAFGLRSVFCTALAWMAVVHQHAAPWRRLAVTASCAVTLAAQMGADWGTHKYRVNQAESTTATMPYWEGCSVATQKRFKIFYAYSQFMATLACIAVCNPAWPLSVLAAIQCASLFMTLVRKGILTARGYHYLYTFTLILPYFVGWRSNAWMQPWSFPAMMVAGAALFGLRARFHFNKYALWIPIYIARIAFMDTPWMPHDVW